MEHLQFLSPVFYVCGYTAGIAAFWVMARRRGMATEGVFAVVAAALIGGLIGAHIAQWFSTGEDGKSILGGFVGGYGTVILYKRLIGITRPLGDLFAVGMSAGEAIGRWGCFFGGCCYGKPSHVAWAIYQHGAWRHPTQAYMSLASLLTFAWLVTLERRGNVPENGNFYTQGLLFCISRLVIEFYRAGAPAIRFLTIAQWACLAGAVFFAYKLRRLRPARAVDFEAVTA